MNKVTRILLAIGLILAVATPALAEFKFGGFYQTIMYNQHLKTTTSKEGESQNFVDQRLRFRPVYSLNDNVAIVYYGEVDTVWGTQDKNAYQNGTTVTGDAGGGKYDTDGINVETKNVYLDLKFGDTTAAIGLYNASDEFQGLIYGGADMAGILATQKFGATTLKLQYAKWQENSDGDYPTQGTATGVNGAWTEWDDQDFYGLAVDYKFSDTFKLGLAGYWVDNNAVGNNADISQNLYYVGPYASATFGNFGVDGFVLYQTGKTENNRVNTTDVDSSALAATVKGTMKIENGDLGLRLLYISKDDDDEDNNAWQGNNSAYDFVKENQMIFLTDMYVANAAKERYAMVDAANAGYGLMAAMLSGNHKLPDAMFLNWGLGYYAALDDERNDEAVKSREGKTLGYEACVRFGKKFFDKVDISANAAYAGFGSFYDNSVNDAGSIDDPDNIYKAYLMVRVPF